MTEEKIKKLVLSQEEPWKGNANKVWIASSLRLIRNVEKCVFPEKLEEIKKKQLASVLGTNLLNSRWLKNPVLIEAEELNPVEKEFLVEHYLTTQSFQHVHGKEAFILDESGAFLALLNLVDHLQLTLLDSSGDLEGAWRHLVDIETDIGKHVNYSFSPKYGFLTADPACCGTGFILTAFLQPTALIHTESLEAALDSLLDNRLILTGIQGDPHEIIGDIIALRNRFTLGVSEEKIISAIRLFTTKLLVLENSERAKLRQKPDPEVLDAVSRAFGVLMYSYQINAIEALDAISLIKLGLDLGWLDGATQEDLNHLFFQCRRAHLFGKSGTDLDVEETLHKRAEFVHSKLKNLKLKI
jgi:protein arginine kinase